MTSKEGAVLWVAREYWDSTSGYFDGRAIQEFNLFQLKNNNFIFWANSVSVGPGCFKP